jgi:hypothetical protein
MCFDQELKEFGKTNSNYLIVAITRLPDGVSRAILIGLKSKKAFFAEVPSDFRVGDRMRLTGDIQLLDEVPHPQCIK